MNTGWLNDQLRELNEKIYDNCGSPDWKTSRKNYKVLYDQTYIPILEFFLISGGPCTAFTGRDYGD
jgi:hypothetical protein